AARKVALAEPMLVNRTISPTSHVTGINVTLEMPEDEDVTPVVVTAARELADRIETRYPHINVYLTGQTMLNNAFAESSMNDMSVLMPIMFGVIVLAMVVLLRSFSGTIGTVLVIVFSAMTAMGLMGWLGMPLTAPTASVPTMVLTLAVADSIHILVTLLRSMRLGESKREAIVHSVVINMQPVFLTSVTTSIGFLSMNFSDVPPLRDLGNATAIGVFAAFGLSIAFLPAMMAILPLRVRAAKADRPERIDAFADFVVRKRTPLLWGSVAVVAIFAGLVPLNELNDEFVNYFHKNVAFRTDTDFTTENLSGIYAAEFSLGSGEDNGIGDPAYLAKIDEFATWYRAQPDVVHVSVLTDTMKRLNQNMHGDDPAWHKLPEQRDLAAQYLLLYEMSLPFGLDLNNQIDINKSATRMIVTMGNVSSREMRALTASGEQWLRQNAPVAMFSHGVGPAVMFSHISDRNIKSMLFGTLVAIGLVAIALCVALRSVKFGLLSMIPNLVPGIMGFGLWAVLYGQINLGLSVVVAMTFGIVVDDSVHFLSKYLRARRAGDDPEAAVRYAFSTVAVALIVTTIVLVGGFSIMAMSSFDMNSGMGKLTALTIAFALAADFFLLPALLMKIERRAMVAAGATAPARQTEGAPAS
ncbi:MMPL family transporter, partial [Candidatus Poribacteria bacterium]|nr:MMPL family transporter [Candidatus Poribacteria bacterium]